MEHKRDRELEEFRSLMEVPSKFEDGFSWAALLGAIFIALVMVPGAIYMSLLAGAGVGPAAQWVTLILFIEVAKRAHKYLNKSEMWVLFFMASAAMGMPFSGLLWHQFFANSDSAMVYGIAEELPSWFAPDSSSESYGMRTFFHLDWLPVIGFIAFQAIFSELSRTVLGYGLFRLTSDIEKLPFPMAPVGAQGIIALAEDVDEESITKKEGSWRWRVFSLGGALGLAFGSVYLLLPIVTGAFTDSPVQIFPIPFSDYTQKTNDYLPAVATGIAWDATNLVLGMVMPFYAMVGSFLGMIFTFVANPILYDFGVLHSWSPGDDTIRTLFNNNVDFYFSFTIGVSLAIAIAGFYQLYRSMKRAKKLRGKSAGPPAGRGDIPNFWVLTCYFVVTMSYILVSGWLIDWHGGVMIVLFVLGFIYTPLISYVTARLEGMVGEVVEVPFVREASLILSGYQGVAVWFLPIPIANYGQMTVFYRQCELTGTKFTSIWKSQLLLYPIILISSIFFMNFIWGMGDVPSAQFPFAQKMWELQAANACITYSSTLGEYSIFEEAFNWTYIFSGATFGGGLFAVLGSMGAPQFLIYGLVRGLGQTYPHAILPQFIGALIGRFYFQRRLGLKWRQYIPVVAAGFSCGMGLIAVLGVGITFLSKAVIALPL